MCVLYPLNEYFNSSHGEKGKAFFIQFRAKKKIHCGKLTLPFSSSFSFVDLMAPGAAALSCVSIIFFPCLAA